MITKQELWSKNTGLYITKKELWTSEGNPPIEVMSAYTLSGDYIGDETLARRLCIQHGIKPEKAKLTHAACSIGFSDKDNKWYGWSHRGMYGYGVGSSVHKGDVIEVSGKFPAGYKAQSLEGAKQMAIAFAEGVS